MECESLAREIATPRDYEYDRPMPATRTGRRILITGGAGFIGSHLVERLIGAGHDVVVLDNLRRNALMGAGLHERPEVTVRVGDVLDRDAVRAAIEGCDAVVHLASVAGVDTV